MTVRGNFCKSILHLYTSPWSSFLWIEDAELKRGQICREESRGGAEGIEGQAPEVVNLIWPVGVGGAYNLRGNKEILVIIMG